MFRIVPISLLILTACSTYNKPPGVVFNKKFDDPDIHRRAEKLYKKMVPEDKKAVVNYYYKYYRFSLTKFCKFPGTDVHLPKIESLKIPALDFQEAMTVKTSEKAPLENAGLWSLNTEESSIHEVIQNRPKNKIHPDSAILIRSNDKERIRYYVCRPTGDEKAVCTEDVFIKKMVNVDDLPTFCKWVSSEKSLRSLQNEKETLEILKLMLRLRPEHNFKGQKIIW
jgi:hypothetical protein